MPGRRRTDLSPRRIEAREKAIEALRLRKGGMSLTDIAERVGYASYEGAGDAIRRLLRELPREDAEDVRVLERERLDALLNSMWAKAMSGDGWAVDRCLRIMERRSLLDGLDAPKVVQVQKINEDAVDQKIKELEQQLSALPPTDRPAIEMDAIEDATFEDL